VIQPIEESIKSAWSTIRGQVGGVEPSTCTQRDDYEVRYNFIPGSHRGNFSLWHSGFGKPEYISDVNIREILSWFLRRRMFSIMAQLWVGSRILGNRCHEGFDFDLFHVTDIVVSKRIRILRRDEMRFLGINFCFTIETCAIISRLSWFHVSFRWWNCWFSDRKGRSRELNKWMLFHRHELLRK